MIDKYQILDRLITIRESSQELINQINKLLHKQDNISQDDIVNLYGYCEGIATEQRILEREILK